MRNRKRIIPSPQGKNDLLDAQINNKKKQKEKEKDALDAGN
jgi:hypothetical protein